MSRQPSWLRLPRGVEVETSVRRAGVPGRATGSDVARRRPVARERRVVGGGRSHTGGGPSRAPAGSRRGGPSRPARTEVPPPAGAVRCQELTAWPLFDKIVRELCALGDAGWWADHHCSESLLDPRLVREVEHVRTLVAPARPAAPGCGGLSPGLLVDLLQLGAGYVRITRYPGRLAGEVAYGPVRRWLVAGGLLEALPWRVADTRHGWAAVYAHDGLRVDVIRPRLAAGRDGAGHRHTPDPADHVTGRVSTCRNLFGDEPPCGHHTIGNRRERSYADLWSSPTRAAFHDRAAGARGTPWPVEGICTERFPPMPGG